MNKPKFLLVRNCTETKWVLPG